MSDIRAKHKARWEKEHGTNYDSAIKQQMQSVSKNIKVSKKLNAKEQTAYQNRTGRGYNE